VHLFNAYGLTEAAVDSTCYAIGAVPQTLPVRLPIGAPLPNVRVLLLDAEGRLVPEGVAGEIHIGGAGVARGYLKRPELTAERFIENPFVAGERLYKTGDLARMTADGALEYLGRNDFQVKIRGHRVELGEIESKLMACEGVREAVVIAREDRTGQMQLIAYCLKDGSIEWRADDLYAALQSRLPEHMVPTAYVEMQVWPLTSNGKIDRKALPLPSEEAFATREYIAPSTPIERSLAELWAGLLKVERVGLRDDFFVLGGHSLLASRLIVSMEELLGIKLTLRELFQAPTIEGTLERAFDSLMQGEFDSV
jgi:acyl-coenzyme A synthetase/AMP-(fatty) acid ligase/acyl carrier protein